MEVFNIRHSEEVYFQTFKIVDNFPKVYVWYICICKRVFNTFSEKKSLLLKILLAVSSSLAS